MKKHNIRWQLVGYDIIIFLVVDFLLLFLYQNSEPISLNGVIQQSILAFVCLFTTRFIGGIYQQIWRYGGIQCYIRLLFVDSIAFTANLILEKTLPIEHISFARCCVHEFAWCVGNSYDV